MAPTIITASLGAIPTVGPASNAGEKPSHFPFLRLPMELRNMIYRNLLVSGRRIHLGCFLPKETDCKHRLVVNTRLLRVCRQISTEALDVLYGENDFVCAVPPSSCERPIIANYFSPANLLRLRILTLVHPCFITRVDVDLEHHYGNAWADDSTDAWDSAGSWDSDDDDCERILAPFPIECLPPATWQPILGNLTRLNLTLAAGCCKFASLEDDSIVSRDEGLKEYASRKIKQVMGFYDRYLSSTVVVHRRVGCDYHSCSCPRRDSKCRKIQRYVRGLWLGDS